MGEPWSGPPKTTGFGLLVVGKRGTLPYDVSLALPNLGDFDGGVQ